MKQSHREENSHMQTSNREERQQATGAGLMHPADRDMLHTGTSAQWASAIPGQRSKEAKPCLHPAAILIQPDLPTGTHGFLQHS